MWVDLSSIGVTLSQGLNRGIHDSVIASIDTSARSFASIKTRLIASGFSELGEASAPAPTTTSSVKRLFMQKMQPAFKPVDLKSWFEKYSDAMINKAMLAPSVDIYDVLERIAIYGGDYGCGASFSSNELNDIPFGDDPRMVLLSKEDTSKQSSLFQ